MHPTSNDLKELKNLQDECKKEAKRCKAKADKRTVEEKYAQLEKELLERHKQELSVYDTDAVPEVDGLAEAAAQVDGGLYSKQTDEPKELTKGQKKKQAKRAKEEEKQRKEKYKNLNLIMKEHCMRCGIYSRVHLCTTLNDHRNVCTMGSKKYLFHAIR